MEKGMHLIRSIVVAAVLLCGSMVAHADYKDYVDFTKLQDELGGALPTGSGVKVTQAEALDGNYYMPDINYYEFAGKTITNVTGGSSSPSEHATSVGKLFYGVNNSMAPGIIEIDIYSATDWLGSGFLRPGGLKQPLVSDSRIANHSWVNTGTSGKLARTDWVIETDDYIQVVGVNNGSTVYEYLATAYNVISVGRTDGNHAIGTKNLGGMYTSGRTKPDLVVPAGATSWATPVVSATSAMLVETGHNNPGLSNGFLTPSRTGMTIYHAETSEVIKAALMAGAERSTKNRSHGNILNYTIDTDNGLNQRYGAGQLNVYNSYHVIAAGETDSLEEGDSGAIGYYGFDYDPVFSKSDEASYFFTADADHNMITASLVWNIDIDGGTPTYFNATATLYDLDLYLFDVTDPMDWILAADSTSTNENTENIFISLEDGRDYMLRVLAKDEQDDFSWDYGLAWCILREPVIGDLNEDGFVGQDDLDIVLGDWGQTVNAGAPPDPSGDGFVGQDDLDIVLCNWNAGTLPGHAPEPGAVFLLLVGSLGLLRRRH